MGRLVLIGGGQNGYHKERYETEAIDREIVALCGRKNPHFLFVGLANGNPDGYCGAMRRIFGKQYGCRIEYLSRQLLEQGNWEKVDKLIGWADIIYAAGGNSLKQLKLFRRYGLDERFRKAFLETDKIFCGISAGAICWCRYGGSDAFHYANAPQRLVKLRGLDFAPLLFCPHFITETYRRDALKQLMRRVRDVPALACDYGAIVVDGDKLKFIALDDDRTAARCCRYGKAEKGKAEKTEVEKTEAACAEKEAAGDPAAVQKAKNRYVEENLLPGKVYSLSKLGMAAPVSC